MPNEEFEKLILEKNPTAVLTISEDDEYIVPRIQHKWEGYQLRQPKIDALIHDNDEMRKSIVEYDKENAALKESLQDRTEQWQKLLEEIAELKHGRRMLQAEVERLRADAARYQWLRNPSIDVGLVLDKVTGEVPVDEGTGGGGYKIYEYRAGDELDAAIDAAMKETK